MAEAEASLQALFAGLPDGVCVSDAEGRVLYLNPAAERIFGVSPAEAAEKTLCALLCERLSVSGAFGESAGRCPLRAAASGQKSVSLRGRYSPRESEGKGGSGRSPLDLRVSCMRMSDPLLGSGEPERYFTVLEDATAESELERHKDEWRDMIAHDLRSPLTSIYGALRVLQDLSPGETVRPDEARLTRISLGACRRMLELVNLYLDVSRLQAGLSPVGLRRLDLSGLARKCAEEQAPLAREKGIELVLDLASALEVLADPELLFRVIENLLDNALKFTPKGGRVALTGRREAGSAFLSVRDTGPGIAQEELPRIFDPYHQARARREGRIQGTGLGLTFCREALRAMKGDIAVNSHPGSGSEFIARLPCLPAQNR